jgi:hypothetical protein
VKEKIDGLCSVCGWSGNAEGLTNCPECHTELVVLDKELKVPEAPKDAEYAAGQVKKSEEIEDVLTDDL